MLLRSLLISSASAGLLLLLGANACSVANAPDDPIAPGEGGGCVAAACPGEDNDCRYRVCDAAGQCAMENAPVGTACDDAGGNACDGGGSCVAKSSQGEACSAPADCASGVCSDGVCCDVACDGVCEACNVAGSEGTCTPHAAGTDPEMECPTGQPCDGAGACTKAPGEACSVAAECASGYCVDGVCCDVECAGVCESCIAASTGGQDGTCAPVTTGTDPDGECGPNQACNGAGSCGCPPSTGNESIDGPLERYQFCWYLSRNGGTCDQTCAELGGANLAVQASNAFPDSCAAASAGDISQMFYMNGNAAGWGATSGATSYHTLGYGYVGSQYYGKCASGTATGNGSFPGDPNNDSTRAVVCPCFPSLVQ